MAMTIPGSKESKILTTLKFLLDSDALMLSLERKYGSPFMMRLMFGDMRMFTRAEEIKQVFSLPHDATKTFASNVLQPLVGKWSLFMLSGEEHKKMRKILMPHFQKGHMKHFGKVINESALSEFAGLRPGESFSFLQAMRKLIMKVMVHSMFGVIEPRRVESYVQVFMSLDEHASGGLFYLNKYRKYLLGLGPWRAFEKYRNKASSMLLEDIQKRRSSAEGGQDILSKLMSLKDENGRSLLDDECLHDQLMTLIFAGYETTASALSWTLNWILLHPKVLAELRMELDQLEPTADSEVFAALPYLDAVCCEALRLSPVINLEVMEALKPVVIGEHTIEAGENLGVCITNAHRSAEVFPEPERFMPERFLNKSYSLTEYFPFGGGSRRCLGAVLAGYEIRVILGKLLRNYEFKLEKAKLSKPQLHGVVVVPRDGVPVVFEGPRQSGPVSAGQD